MPTGYQLVEPASLDWLSFAPRHYDVAVMFLSWMALQLNAKYNEVYPGIEVVVIKVSYSGDCPCIAIRYPSGCDIDIGPEIDEAVAALVDDANLKSLLLFATTCERSWSEVASELMGRDYKDR